MKNPHTLIFLIILFLNWSFPASFWDVDFLAPAPIKTTWIVLQLFVWNYVTEIRKYTLALPVSSSNQTWIDTAFTKSIIHYFYLVATNLLYPKLL